MTANPDPAPPPPQLPPPPLPKSDPALMSPLAPWQGRAPESPAWFRDAIAFPHRRHMRMVENAGIEWLEWGERGQPGIIFIHGGAAHADWWRFVAPFFAEGRHIIAPSLSGMGGSGHRMAYSVGLHAREILALAAAAGMVAPFTVIAHSYGGYVAVDFATRHPQRVAQLIVLDTPFPGNAPVETDARPPHRVYPTLEAALARFRWSPAQPTPHPFIADFIARASLKAVDGGWQWKFDANLWARSDFTNRWVDLAALRVPFAYVGGEKSFVADRFATIRGDLPPGGRMLLVPEAHHQLMMDQPIAVIALLRALLI